MTYEEFKARTDKDVTFEIFRGFEKMYMAGDMDKDVFCRMVRAEVKRQVRNNPHKVKAMRLGNEASDCINRARLELVPSGSEEIAVKALENALGLTRMYFAEIRHIEK